MFLGPTIYKEDAPSPMLLSELRIILTYYIAEDLPRKQEAKDILEWCENQLSKLRTKH